MNITKAIQRIGWRFTEATKKNNTFVINQTDVDAFNIMVDYVDRTQTKQYQDNELFAKLYIYTTMKILSNDGTGIFDNNHRKKLGNLLKMPLSQLIDMLTESLNDSERYELIKQATGSDLKHPVLQNSEERSTNIEKIKESIKTAENKDRLLGRVFDYETVKEMMLSEVNLQINLNN